MTIINLLLLRSKCTLLCPVFDIRPCKYFYFVIGLILTFISREFQSDIARLQEKDTSFPSSSELFLDNMKEAWQCSPKQSSWTSCDLHPSAYFFSTPAAPTGQIQPTCTLEQVLPSPSRTLLQIRSSLLPQFGRFLCHLLSQSYEPALVSHLQQIPPTPAGFMFLWQPHPLQEGLSLSLEVGLFLSLCSFLVHSSSAFEIVTTFCTCDLCTP